MWAPTLKSLHKLQLVLNVLTRLLTDTHQSEHATPILKNKLPVCFGLKINYLPLGYQTVSWMILSFRSLALGSITFYFRGGVEIREKVFSVVVPCPGNFLLRWPSGKCFMDRAQPQKILSLWSLLHPFSRRWWNLEHGFWKKESFRRRQSGNQVADHLGILRPEAVCPVFLALQVITVVQRPLPPSSSPVIDHPS